METYVSSTARYPPKLWARLPTDYGVDTPATTNGCESFHRHIKDHVGTCHPNLYKFTKALREPQEMVYSTPNCKRLPYTNLDLRF